MGVADMTFAYIRSKNRKKAGIVLCRQIGFFITEIGNRQYVSEKDRIMKKIIMITLTSCMLVFCLGCGVGRREEEHRTVGEFTLDIARIKANKIMETLWDFIEKGDAASIMGMLSENAKKEIIDCEGKVMEFLEAFEGSEIIEVVYGGGGGSSGSSEHGKTTRYRVNGNYYIKTTKGTYELDFGYVVANKMEPEEVGLDWIFLKPDDEREYYGGGKYNIFVYPFEE